MTPRHGRALWVATISIILVASTSCSMKETWRTGVISGDEIPEEVLYDAQGISGYTLANGTVHEFDGFVIASGADSLRFIPALTRSKRGVRASAEPTYPDPPPEQRLQESYPFNLALSDVHELRLVYSSNDLVYNIPAIFILLAVVTWIGHRWFTT